MVFYRKYRSQTIAELDNSKLRETLYALFQKPDAIAHAFLFTGPKGLGKTSTARIIAKVINCERNSNLKSQNSKTSSPQREPLMAGQIRNKKEVNETSNYELATTNDTIEPCNQCTQCISITAGNNLDVLEIDGASNRGIDEIRDLREKIRLAPSSAKKKVYIIDEVHMLTTEAFNALLKTIEEPPAHVIFVFCTTEPQKIPATIVSRCFHIALTPATEDELLRSFKRVVVGEKIAIDDSALMTIAKLADGGFRDGVKILEEINLLAEGKAITSELVEQKYQMSNIKSQIASLLEYVAEKKTKEALALIASVTEQGMEVKYFISQLLHELHSLLLEKMGIISPRYKLQVTSYKLEIEDIKNLVLLLTKAYQETKYAVVPQLPLEMAVISWGLHAQNNQYKKELDFLEKPTMSSLLKKQKSIEVNAVLGKSEPKTMPKITVAVTQAEFPSHGDEKKSLLENLIYSVQSYNHSVAAVLRSCAIKNIDDETIIFETAYKFHKERLEDKKSLQILGKVIKEITGKDLRISVVLKKASSN